MTLEYQVCKSFGRFSNLFYMNLQSSSIVIINVMFKRVLDRFRLDRFSCSEEGGGV